MNRAARSVPTRETYDELQVAYSHFNGCLFEGALPDCLITLQREKSTCGYFSAKRFARSDGETTDEIALNPSYFAVVPLVETMQTLVHEMAHLWQHHFGSPGRVRYHNEEWASKMEACGLMPSSTGRPGGKRTGDKMADYALTGGLFLQACAALFTTSYSLSWYDRFPAIEHVRFGASSLSAELPPEVGGGAAPLTSHAMLAGVMHVSASVAEDGTGAGGTAANKSNRTKYVCACRSAVWGKPGLVILCGVCEEAFDAQ